MNGPGIEEYPPKTMEFYASCIEPSQLNTVVAATGGMKTFFLLNLANFANIAGLPVCFVNLQMHIKEIQPRVLAIAHNLPLWDVLKHEVPFSQQVLDQAESIRIVNLQGARSITATDVESAVIKTIRILGRPVLVLVDGLESMAEYDHDKMDAVVARLGNIATEQEVCVWMTAQGNRQSVGREIFDIPGIADTSSKGQISSQVIALGPRLDNELLTASWPKVRSGRAAFARVVRLVVRPSVRLEVFEVIGTPIRPGATPESLPQPEFIGIDESPAPDEPATPVDENDPDMDDNDDAAAAPPLRPYHGLKGWVGIGRAVSGSPMFTNRKAKYVFWLLDLYFMAQFAPDTLYAPNTRHPVKLARGQIMTSPRMLAERWGTKRKQVETFLATAAREGLITVETEFRSHRELQGDSTAGNPTKEPKEKAFCTVITLLHYYSKDDPAQE